ncbi:MAG: glycerol-3-phosphate 1-O-acyltransferase PlsY [Hyphomicrobiaceae bacterium]
MNLLLPALLVGYLVGSIPFGLIFTRIAGYGDVRKIGSGNIGATNVLRTGNKCLAAATLLFDALKGTAAVILGPLAASLFLVADSDRSAVDTAIALAPAAYAAGVAAFFGHVFPVWLGFRGGKGVAVYIGVLLGLVWPAAIVFCAIWLGVAITTRYSSLSALASSFITPFAAFYVQNATAGGVAAIMSIILILKHRANIQRLVSGEEPKIGTKG